MFRVWRTVACLILPYDTKSPALRRDFLVLLPRSYSRELLMVLKVLPILGPSKRMTAITTIATRARIIAYSTRPCPFSLGANNMLALLSSRFDPEEFPQYFHDMVSNQKLQPN